MFLGGTQSPRTNCWGFFWLVRHSPTVQGGALSVSQRVQVSAYQILRPRSVHIESTVRPKYIMQEYMDLLRLRRFGKGDRSIGLGQELGKLQRAQTRSPKIRRTVWNIQKWAYIHDLELLQMTNPKTELQMGSRSKDFPKARARRCKPTMRFRPRRLGSRESLSIEREIQRILIQCRYYTWYRMHGIWYMRLAVQGSYNQRP